MAVPLNGGLILALALGIPLSVILYLTAPALYPYLMDDPEVVAHLAELLWMTGEPDDARALLTNSLNEFPDDELLIETQARLLR